MGIAGIGADCGWQRNVYQGTGTEKESRLYEDILSAAIEAFRKDGSAGSGFTAEDSDVSSKNETGGKELTREEMLQVISEKREEIYEKIKNNDTETSFQIGNQSFTIKEWDKLLEQFDSVQEEIREQMREEQAKRQKKTTTKVLEETTTSVTSKDSTDIAKAAGVVCAETSQSVTEDTDEKSVMDSLVTESTTCTYPASGEEDSDEKFITWYTKEGIFCRKAGQTSGYFFRVTFDDPSQYEKVMNFLQQIPSDADMRFTANMIFWQKFLAGEIDEQGFNSIEYEDLPAL